ncbi:MAG: carboxypeptidase regulatory-like domain-containing protein [Thermoflexales bacterium]|nr:carboxypeptidase regulatory-like domain-containing protein [Thermoflexales bacterium]
MKENDRLLIRRWPVLLLCLLVPLALLSAGMAGAEQGRQRDAAADLGRGSQQVAAALSGTVVNPDGSAITGAAEVYLWHMDPSGDWRDWETQVSAPASGGGFSFDLGAIPSEYLPGPFFLQAESAWNSPYFRSLVRQVNVPDVSIPITWGNVTLTYASFAGVVFEPDEATPASNGRVGVDKLVAGRLHEVAWGDYDESGAYAVGGVPGGDGWLVAHAPEDSIFWGSAPASVTVEPGSQFTSATQARNLTLQNPTLTGTVVYPEPAPGVLVQWLLSDTERIGWADVRLAGDNSVEHERPTASWGEFGFRVPAGSYQVQAWPEGSLVMSYTSSLPAPVDVPSDTHTGPLTLTYPSVAGQVRGPAGEVVPGCAGIWLEELASGDWVASDEYCGDRNGGAYRLGGVKDGQYWLKADAPDGSGFFPPAPVSITVDAGSQYDPYATQAVPLRLASPQVEVYVKDPAGYAAAARVVLWNEGHEAWSNSLPDGRPAAFGNLAAGQAFKIVAWPLDDDIPTWANSIQAEVIAPATGTVSATLALQEPSIVGTVTTPEGGPLPQAYGEDGAPWPNPAFVGVHSLDGNVHLEWTTNMSGEFSLAVPAGDYTLVANPKGSNGDLYTPSVPERFGLLARTLRDLGAVRLTYPSVAGMVYASQNHDPIPACMDVWLEDGVSGEWAASEWYCGDSPYRLGGVPSGHYWLKTGGLPEQSLFPPDPLRVYVAPDSQYSPTATQPISLYLMGMQVEARVLDPRSWPTATVELAGRVILGDEWGERVQVRSAPGSPAQFGGLEPGQYWVAALPDEGDMPTLANSAKRWFCIGDSALCPVPRFIDLFLRLPDVVGVVRLPGGGALPQAFDWEGNPVSHPAMVRVHNQDWSVDFELPTNLNGEFSLALGNDGYQLLAYPEWSTVFSYTKSMPVPFALTSSAVRPLDLGEVWLTYPRLVGVVVDGQDRPVSTNVKVWKDDYSYEDWDDTVVEPGKLKPFRFGGMPEGAYSVQSEPPWDNPNAYGSSNIESFSVDAGSQYLPTSTEQITLYLGVPSLVGDLRFPLGYTPTGALCPPEGCGVKGVDVRARTADWSYEDWAHTDAGGRFTFSGLDAGMSVTLDFFLPDELRPDWDPPRPPVTFDMPAGTETVTVTYRLLPAVRNKRIYGAVVDQHGNPVGPGAGAPGEAMVYARREDSGQWIDVPADSDGAYEFFVRDGRWTLGVKPVLDNVDWYFDPAWERTVAFTQPVGIAESRQVTLTVMRADFVTVYGRVLDPDDNPPPAGSTWVDLCSDNGRCFGAPVNEYGRFNLRVVPGVYRVWVRVNDANLAPPANNGFFVAVDGGVTLDTIYLRWATRPSRISGQVVISPAGLGLAGVTLRGWSDTGDWASAQSVTNGVYALDVFPGYWHVEAAMPASLADSYVVLPPKLRESEVGSGQTISNVNFYVRRLDATLRGLVVDAGGAILSDVDAVVFVEYCTNANVCLRREAKVQAGAFSLKVVGGYTYTLGIWLPPGSPYVPGPIAPAADVYVGAGGARSDVRISLLLPGARIHGFVLDAGSLARLDIPAAIYASTPGGLLVEDKLGPGKFEYNLPVPLSNAAVTWTVGVWVDPASGYVVSRPNPVQLVVSPAVTDVVQNLYVKPLAQVITGVARLDGPLGAPARYVQVFARGKPETDSAGRAFETRADASGVFTMPVLPGVYLVGAYPPPDASFGYLPPGLVEWDAEADNPVLLVFRPKPPPAQVIEITGTLSVTPAGAIATDAPILVFGHGSDGRRAQVTGTLAGGYRMEVVSSTTAAGVTWYLWAVYEDPANNAYYHSDELEVTVRTASVPNANLALERAPFELPAAVCQDVDPSRFTRIFLPARSDLPEPLLEIQAGTFSETVQVCARPAVAALDGQYLVGFSYEMEARDSAGNLITANFNKKVRFIFYLDAAAIPAGVNVEDLIPAYYSTSRQAWTELDDPFVDAEDLFVTGKADHFSRFGACSPPNIEEPTAVRLLSAAARGPAGLPIALAALLAAALFGLALLSLKALRRSRA